MLKVVITLILLLLLEGIKRLVFRSGQPSDFFYYNLLSCAQLIILLGGIIIIITRPLFRRLVKQRRMLWQVMFFLALLGLLELGCNYLLNHPRSIPAAVFPAFKFYYDHFECRIIQYEPEHTRFHPALFYKLKNDQRFTYSNREYSNAFHTNSKGLRDDEPSLRAPEIICLGDSYTLGWGAEEAEAWPTLVQKQTGLNLLNAGMSSYGTARESMVLAGLDTSNVKYIIWQYCANDAEENSAYLAGNRSLPTHQPQDLDSLMELHSWTRKYFPGRHFFTITKLAVSQFLARKKQSSPAAVHTNDSLELAKAQDFLNIVKGSGVDLSKTKIIVLDLGPYPIQHHFIKHLQKLVNTEGLSSGFILLDCTTILKENDFYTLDVHLTPPGNQRIADSLSKLIQPHTP